MVRLSLVPSSEGPGTDALNDRLAHRHEGGSRCAGVFSAEQFEVAKRRIRGA